MAAKYSIIYVQCVQTMNAVHALVKNLNWQRHLPTHLSPLSLTYWGRDKMAAIFQTTLSLGLNELTWINDNSDVDIQ